MEKMTIDQARIIKGKCISGTWECGCIGGTPDEICLISEGFIEGYESREEEILELKKQNYILEGRLLFIETAYSALLKMKEKAKLKSKE